MDKIKALWKKFELEWEASGKEKNAAAKKKLSSFKTFLKDNLLGPPETRESAANYLKESVGVAEDDFIAWWNTDIATDEESKIIKADVEDLYKPSKVEFQQQVPQEVSGKISDPEMLQDFETYGIPSDSFSKFSTLWGVNPKEETVFEWIANNQEEGPAAQAYLNLMTGENILRPKYTDKGEAVIINGQQAMMPFAGHFGGTKVQDVIDSYASTQDIEQFQNFMTNSGIVPDNYFAESQGEYSEKLRASIKYVMNWLDKNRHVVPGTETYDVIMDSDPVYFSDSQITYEGFDYHRNLFKYALEEMAKEASITEDIDEAEVAKQLAKEFIPPSQNALEDMVDSYFESKLGRGATEEELDEWSTKFADSYSIAFGQARAKAKQYEDYNFMVSQPEYLEMDSQREQLAKDYGADKFIDLSAFSTDRPEEIMAQQVEDEFGKQISAVEQGRKVRTMQNDMITYMFGG